MNVTQSMILATGLTAVRVFAERVDAGVVVNSDDLDQPDETTVTGSAGAVARVVVAGTLATGILLVWEQFNPLIARQFSVLILLTSFLVNGVGLAEIIGKVIRQ